MFDEHGVIEDKEGVLSVNDKLRLVPATVTLHVTCMTGTLVFVTV